MDTGTRQEFEEEGREEVGGKEGVGEDEDVDASTRGFRADNTDEDGVERLKERLEE